MLVAPHAPVVLRAPIMPHTLRPLALLGAFLASCGGPVPLLLLKTFSPLESLTSSLGVLRGTLQCGLQIATGPSRDALLLPSVGLLLNI